MNTTEPGVPEPETHRAGHAGGAYDADIAECRKMISERAGLNYIAHVTAGICDFAVEMPGWSPRGQDMATASERAGRQLSLTVAELNSACEPLDSGVLIRVVVQGENGALFHVLKVPGQTFFGLAHNGGRENIDRADRQLSRLAESAAGRVGSAPLLWGGFASRAGGSRLRLAQDTGSQAPASGQPYVIASSGTGVPGAVAKACRQALHHDDLHYVGFFRRGRLVWYVDIFEDPALAPLFQRVSAWSRREGYDHLVRQITLQIRRFRQMLALVSSDHLTRLVLDVARGAIYVLPLSGDEALVGVTLLQADVERTDKKMAALHESVRLATGQDGGEQRIRQIG
jgi:hypothetical protein